MHQHSDTDRPWLLCNPVNLASVSSTQRHVFELLCDKVPWYPWKPGGFHPAAHSRKISYIYHYTHVHRFGWNICLLHAYIHTFWPMYGTHEYISLLLPILSLLGPMCESTHIYIYIYLGFLEPMYIHKPPGAHIHTPYTHKYVQIYTHPYIPSHW